MLTKHEANPQENNHAETRSQQSRFATLPTHGYAAENPQHTLLQENTSAGLLLYVKRILKDLNYKDLIFTVVIRNLLTLKSKLKKLANK